jgi:hypothetical protein
MDEETRQARAKTWILRTIAELAKELELKITAMQHYVFLDGSGKPEESEVVGFCGYLAHAETWDALRPAWKDKLRLYGLTTLHTKHAMNLHGEFHSKAISWGPPKFKARDDLLLDFVRLIKAIGLRGVGCLIESRLLKPHQIKRGDLALLESVVRGALSLLRPDEALSLFVDDEQGFAHLCYDLYSKLKKENADVRSRLKAICFGDDESFAGLQAADLFAYLAREELMRKTGKTSTKPNPVWVELIRETSGDLGIVNIVDFWDASKLSEAILKKKKQ